MAVVVGAGLVLAASPPVGGAEARVAETLAAHHAVDAGPPPPTRVSQAVIAVEDARFYAHHGIDVFRVARALWGNLTKSGDQGGSTISQQLAKQLYANRPGVAAKVEQLGLAVKLEQRYSKAEILEMYLNAVYYGHSHWGIDSASRGYIGKAPGDLDWAEASLLAGLPQAPSALDPVSHFDAARRRQQTVLRRLVQTGRLSESASRSAYRELTALPR